MGRPVLALTLLAGLLSACAPASPPAAPAPAAPAPIAPKPVLGSFGFDSAGMDRSVAPGDDFFAFANGAWVRGTEIPADRSDYGAFSLIDEQAERDVRAIIDAAAQDPSATGDRRKAGDAYAAFSDEAGIEARGLQPMQDELASIASIADRRALARHLGGTLRADVDLLNRTDYYTPRLFGLWITQSLLRPSEVVPYLVQGGLGMPDRDFYLKDGRMAEVRGAYGAYVARILKLADTPDSEAAARSVLALETAIARVHATQVETNDVRRGANEWRRDDFARKAPGLDWSTYFEAAGLGNQNDFIVSQPAAVSGISKLVATAPLESWRAWLRFHALDRAARFLPKAFAEARFGFYGTTLSGTPRQRDRWKQAIDVVNATLGEAVGRLYVEQRFPASTRARAEQMVANLTAAFGRRIDQASWMSDATRARARAKLDGLRVAVGYPVRWRDYSALQIRRDDALGNAERSSLFEYRRNLAKLGRPPDRDEWFLLPHEVNALNIPLENRLIFPAAILQPPFFDAAADDAVNYGAIGALIGHEISHSFDNTGALFDEAGKLANWWTAEDFKRFDAAAATLVRQYDAYRPFPDLAVNGRLTLGENIADVAGLATAFDAWQVSQRGLPARTLEGFTPEQRFFLGYGQSWRSKTREPAQRTRIISDVHAPDEFRTETVRNQDGWYAAFGVQPGQRRYLAPEQRVRIW